MNARKGHRRKLAALAILGLIVGVFGAVHASTPDDSYDGMRLQADNDLFSGQHHDRDYTGGLALTLSGERAREGSLSLDPLLARVDEIVGVPERAQALFARQVGFIAFTPKDLKTSTAMQDDRPYASLFFASNGRMSVAVDQRSAWFSSLTIGALGLPLAKDLQNGIHSVVGSDQARGYSHQISAGGEPTARYALAYQQLLFANPDGNLDVKATLQGGVGFLTNASAAVSLRYGLTGSPWWSSTPELADYMSAPVPMSQHTGRLDIYLFTGARIEARAYNAMLQGQFRHSDVRYASSELEPVIVHAWFGFVTELFARTQLSYTLNYQSAEVRTGRAARDSLWGAVQMTRTF
ncbi:MAG: lipid A deacylase LpxR family protein [Steroidobacteraceae bacterium]